MVILLVLVGAVALAWPVTAGLAGASRPRERDRRLRYVARHPQHVNTGDIARLLGRELSRPDVDLILDRAAALGVRPWTMYSWVQRFDVHTLSVVIAAELPHEELLRHLADDRLPDLGELEVFASLNGLPTAGPKPVRRAAPRAALAGPATRRTVPVVAAAPVAPLAPAADETAADADQVTSKLPPIFEPGSWPYDQFGIDLPEWPQWPHEGPAQPGPLAA